MFNAFPDFDINEKVKRFSKKRNIAAEATPASTLPPVNHG
jgi:hypothetical protein